MALVTVNAGSSSVKAAVFAGHDFNTPVASHAIEHIGSDATPTLADAVDQMKAWLATVAELQSEPLEAIGHRVVHGGPVHTTPTMITDDLVTSLHSLTPLAPNHMPGTLEAIAAFRSTYPDIPHVACFDTGFFADIPDVAKTLPIPLSLQRDNHIRRYGFHGLAYEGLLDSFRTHEGEAAANGRVIMAHLGSGASLTACKNGRPLDMSMGFTPVSGIMMSTRSGDVEPGVIAFLQKHHGLSADEVTNLVTHQSGLLGVSESTADMQVLLAQQATDEKAALAVSLFCYTIAKTIGAYTAVLGGIDSIIFSGGIGERSAEVRRRILENLGYLGIALDDTRNQAHERCISSDDADVGVHVILAREDTAIAKQTMTIIETQGDHNE